MTRADLFCWLSITGQAIKSKESFQYPNEWFSYGHKLTLLALSDVGKAISVLISEKLTKLTCFFNNSKCQLFFNVTR